MKHLFRLFILLSLLVAPLLGTTPVMAQAPGFYTGNGSEIVELTYELTMQIAPFCINFLLSADVNADGGDSLLSQYCIADPALRTAGIHSVYLTLGTDIELVSDATEVGGDYYLIADCPIYDYLFEGVYQYPDVDAFAKESAFVHGTGGDDFVIVNPDGSLVLNGASSGPFADLADYRVRMHGGNDSVDMANKPANSALVQLGAGDDIVKPGSLRSALYGGNGTDTLDLRHAPGALMVDMPASAASWGFGNVMNIYTFENVYGSPHDDDFYGDAANNWIDGQGGNDDINGGAGHDTLRGGPGYDTIWGGAGNDTCNVGPDGGHAYGDAGFDTLIGSDVDDILVGGDDGDRFAPGLGTDMVYGELGRDTVDYFHPTATGGAYVNLSSLTATDQGGSYDWIQGVEDVLGTPYDDILVGSSSMNFLSGRDGNDQIDGRAGHDTLWGGLGADYLMGEARDDIMYANDDTCTDDGAVDTLQGYQGNDTGYGVIGGQTPDIFIGVENIIPCP